MIEKPDLSDEAILTCLRSAYDYAAVGLDFLPVGNDAAGWVYRARGVDGDDRFVKVKRGEPPGPVLLVPRFLRDKGIQSVVAPLFNRDGALWQSLRGYGLIMYPFIEGVNGMDAGLSAGQWTAFGTFLKRIHATSLPQELLEQVPRETFAPRWAATVHRLRARVRAGGFRGAVERDLAAFWREHDGEIARLVDRAEELGRELRARSPVFVLCHADIHTANLLIDGRGDLHIVDWDQPILAPLERDLMFVTGQAGPSAGRTGPEGSFFAGYGDTNIDSLALAYYRYEWVVQEIGDYGERVFWLDNVGEATRRQSVREFIDLFAPGDVVAEAYEAEAQL